MPFKKSAIDRCLLFWRSPFHTNMPLRRRGRCRRTLRLYVLQGHRVRECHSRTSGRSTGSRCPVVRDRSSRRAPAHPSDTGLFDGFNSLRKLPEMGMAQRAEQSASPLHGHIHHDLYHNTGNGFANRPLPTLCQ